MRAKELKETTALYGDFSSKIFIEFLTNKVTKQLKAAAVVLKGHADVIEKNELQSLNAFGDAITKGLASIRTVITKAKHINESHSTHKQLDRLGGDLETFRDQIRVLLRELSTSHKYIDNQKYKDLIREVYHIVNAVDKATTGVVTEIDAVLDPQKAKTKQLGGAGLLGKLKTALST